MEALISDEVKDMISWLKKNVDKPVSINKKFNLAVLNSLWMIMTGQRYDHDDQEQLNMLDEVNLYANI